MSGFRVGLMDLIVAGRPAADTFTRLNYFSAVAMGVDSFWVPDHLNAIFPRSLWQSKYCGAARIQPSVDASMEPWAMLGNIAARNRISRLPLGIGVTDAGRRNPAVTAQAAATMNLLTRGRFILGIGPGEREGNEPYGVEWSKPVARFEQAMATIRALWDSKGELVNRDSPFFPLRNAVFDLPSYKGRWPQIWIGAHGPRMLRVVGRYADGYFPAFPHRPEEYARRLEAVRAAASDAGRDPMAIVPAILMPILTGLSRDDIDEALESDVLKTAALSASDEFFAQHGAQHPLGVGFIGGQDLLPQTLDEQTVLSHIKGITPAFLRSMMLTGTPDEVIEQAAEWRDCGVRHLVASNISFLQPRLRNGFASTVPFFRIMRRLRKL
ncbi:LLM class flavin-dependent oxidoreductase [Mycobacterium sp.]|jgi:phthiodiolone/phenolphthiodiolone dimycocerosates ketoreductase|uniref:LLM class flavin-dependent oxidoreductase n=1 Tax=Mycobacterium sp. TaxID=1785 RepID=UPI002BD4BE1C|nr:LLM class flavin-dependent oxidoreductase [Mycobacterium sp.]HTH88209.1 LLM class flavin-dependent oxidoreductase [Mycobacterium sp.]